MNRIGIPLLLVLGIAVAVAATWYLLDRGAPRDSGSVTTEERALPPFSRIQVDGMADVVLVQGASHSIGIEGTRYALQHFRSEVRDGTLVVSGAGARPWWSIISLGRSRPPRVTVTFRELDGISVSGTVNFRGEALKTQRLAVSASGATSLKIGALEARELVLEGSGAVKADIAGRVSQQSIAISGAGDYRAGNLESERATVAVSGAGRVVINASKALAVQISGAGSVEYLGNPELTQKISGAGRVRRRDAAQEPRTGFAAAPPRSLNEAGSSSREWSPA